MSDTTETNPTAADAVHTLLKAHPDLAEAVLEMLLDAASKSLARRQALEMRRNLDRSNAIFENFCAEYGINAWRHR